MALLLAEYILRVLQVKKVTFISYDLASDEDAKKLWRRKAPRGEYDIPARPRGRSSDSLYSARACVHRR